MIFGLIASARGVRVRSILCAAAGVVVCTAAHAASPLAAPPPSRGALQWLPDTLAAEPFALSADTAAALTRMGYHVVPLELWGTGNAAEAVGVAPVEETLAKTLGFPRPGLLYGASDARAPAGAAASP